MALVALSLSIECRAKDKDKKHMAPKPGDWENLFSGKLHQFRGYKLYDFPKKSWKLEKGELKSIVGAPQIDLISLSLYEDFELEAEWRVTKGSDGGILYRVMEDEGPTWYSGLEYQLIDDSELSSGADANRTAGSLFDVLGAPAVKPSKPIGEYNVTKIRVQGNLVEHWLNGQKIVSYDLSSPDFRDAVSKSRFKNLPRFGREKEGHLCLQHMGSEVAFRSIRVRKLPASELAPTTPPAVTKN